MKIVGERLRLLRKGVGLSQLQMGAVLKATQSSVNRYELGLTSPPYELLLQYADYFDVSMDYIFGRTDNPQGKQYAFEPKITAENKEMKRFVEMCFDPDSPMNERLKQTLLTMLQEEGG